MNILHYSLGFPPYRSGGMIKFCMELAQKQSQDNNVFILWPGCFKKKNDVLIKYHGKKNHIHSYELINPLPVPLMYGVASPNLLMKKCLNSKIFENFLLSNKIEVIHLHTLMGIYLEFFLAAKKLGIRIIYTTHDYYGLCLKTTMYFNGENCSNHLNCARCNLGSLEINKLNFFQSKKYRFLKKTFIFSFLKKHKKAFTIGYKDVIYDLDESSYNDLYSYYQRIFRTFDHFHFNSEVSKKIYQTYLPWIQGTTIHLTELNFRKIEKKCFSNDKIRIGFVASPREDKGYFDLIKILGKFDKKFLLNVYGFTDTASYVISNKKYSSRNIDKALGINDLIIIPSKWNETFGYSTIEALSLSIPVIISDRAGAKALVNENFGWIYNSNKELEDILRLISIDEIKDKSKQIYQNYNPESYNNFSKKVFDLYKEGLD